MAIEKHKTTEFRVSFPEVFEPGKPDDRGNRKYSITMLFAKDDPQVRELRKLAKGAIVAKFGEDKKNWPPVLRALDLGKFLSMSGKDGWPFRDGDSRAYDGYQGMVSVKATTKDKPGLVDQARKPITDPSKFYAGCYARATIHAYFFENKEKGAVGVAFGLQNIQMLREGEPFSSRTRAEDDFEAVGGAADDYSDGSDFDDL